jgi:uncharacterized membrane protein YgcG
MKIIKVVAILAVVSTPLLMSGCATRVYDDGYYYDDVVPIAPVAPFVFYDGFGGGDFDGHGHGHGHGGFHGGGGGHGGGGHH